MEQMYRLWDSEREFFGGQDPMNYKSKGPLAMNFTGKTLGHIILDPVSKVLKVIPLKENEEILPENPNE